ncbi:MAG: M14 family zinc carboxypeptidase, partial [Planctomycetota bacterium]
PEQRADGTIRLGDWIMVGMEGIDNDGDGSVNEDGPGGYDMNRNFPADWQPEHVQGGAGDWPLSYPETEAVARFILSRPNIAAGQAYHNAGGMILRGPGNPSRENAYAGDRRVYEAIADLGVEMLPGYRSMVIHSDLYPVRGGFVNWLAESLGVVSFTNELWTELRITQNGSAPDAARTERWRRYLLFNETRAPLVERDHPTFGRILVGGTNKWASRIPPSWMLEEECHRNAAFTIFHAEQMPRVAFGATTVRAISPRLFEVTVEIRNDALIPTRTARAAETRSGVPDRVLLTPAEGVTISASGTAARAFDTSFSPDHETPRIVELEGGIPSRGARLIRFYAEGPEGGEVKVVYRAEKARTLEQVVTLKPSGK